MSINYDFSRRVRVSIPHFLRPLIHPEVQGHLHKFPNPLESLWFRVSPKLLEGTEQHPLSG
jgi:hypothetical protein